ncbi:hypothetical protein ATANTOWER_001186, partial [Ataeniobius toweri]|nr:hypothetical protein [Ataeniobius toweri]
CSSVDRGGCSQLCTPITPSRWKCGCLPGYRLHQDGKSCIASGPAAFLIVANLMDVRRMNPDGTEEQTLVKEPRGTILALDYDPVHHHVYFASTSQKTIERVDLNVGSRDILVSDGLDSPEGLAIDWVHHMMYWTDKSKPAVDCSTLDGLNRRTVVREGLEKPRGIAVHPQIKKLFWTDTGAQPMVESATLEGSDRVIIASTNLVSPTGLTIDFTDNRLFWCDQKTGLIETAALDGSDRRILIENQVGRPFDLAVFEDKLWVSEWEHQQIRSINKRTGKKLQYIHGSLVQPASLVVVHPLAKPGADACLHLNGGCSQECESNLGFSHCSCLPHFILSADGKSCLSANASNVTAESGESETSDLTSLRNGTLYEESMPPTGDNRKADFQSDGGRGNCSSLHCAVNAKCLLDAGKTHCLCKEGFTGDGQICLDIDECKLGLHSCDKHAECQNSAGKYLCRCQTGYYGNGQKCYALESTSSKVTSQTPIDVTTRQHSSNSAERCPPSHDAFCLYHGVCVYFPQMDSYACNCVPGYMGERCQFSDLEWLELQQAEREKERNLVISSCMVVLISLISITACITYCFRTRRLFLKQSSVDNVSEISMTDESMSETTTTSVPRFFMVTENCVDNETIQPHPRRADCLLCSTETGSNPLSEELAEMFKHGEEHERSMLSVATTETIQPTAHHSRPSLSSSSNENSSSVKPAAHINTPSPESCPS